MQVVRQLADVACRPRPASLRSCRSSAFASESSAMRRFAVPSIIVTASICCITPSCSSPAIRMRSCSCAFISRSLSAVISRSMLLDDAEADAMRGPDQREHHASDERHEPRGLVVRRGNREIDAAPASFQTPLLLRGDDAEAVLGRDADRCRTPAAACRRPASRDRGLRADSETASLSGATRLSAV